MRQQLLFIFWAVAGCFGLADCSEVFAQIQPAVIDGVGVPSATEPLMVNREPMPQIPGQSVFQSSTSNVNNSKGDQFVTTTNNTQNARTFYAVPETLPLTSNQSSPATSKLQFDNTTPTINIQAVGGQFAKPLPNLVESEASQYELKNKILNTFSDGLFPLWNDRESLFQQGTFGACTLNRQGPAIRSCP